MEDSKFIYGIDETTNVVAVEIVGDQVLVFMEHEGVITSKSMPYKFWILYNSYSEVDGHDRIALNGGLFYKYAETFTDKNEFYQALQISKKNKEEYYAIWNLKEQFLVKSGVTSFMDMQPNDLSVLSFDIETTGLVHDKSSKVLLISNTFRRGDTIEKKLFSLEDYDSQKELIDAWCKYIQSSDPTILLGHNIFGFDLPYLKYCAGTDLNLGRDGSPAKFGKYTQSFRKDGSQTYDYKNVEVFGRQVIDTFFLSIKYDFARHYPSYGLKAIIEYEGLEKENRIKWDFDKCKPINAYNDREFGNDWGRFKEYCKDDADDALKLWDLMIPAYFYYAQYIPKTLQQIINGATGSQVNSFMIRSYVALKHSIPKADETIRYEGGMVQGNPGVYKNVGKMDVASFYTSIIIQYKICNTEKDPQSHFLRMVETFTDERLKNKKLAKDTGERRYSDLSNAQKILINSTYGFLNAPGLNFNSPIDADRVTMHGRDIIRKAVEWATDRGWTIVNVDTDSFSFITGEDFNKVQFHKWIEELNALCPSKIIWEDDGIYDDVLVVKMKNYVLKERGKNKVVIKGSALKASMKEPALREFINEVLFATLEGKNVSDIYLSYVRRISTISSDNVNNWASKKTVTKAILENERTNEKRVREAIQRARKIVQEGDKIYTFFKDDKTIELLERFDGEYDKDRLYNKLFNTAKIFETIYEMDLFPNFKLKKNKKLLEETI